VFAEKKVTEFNISDLSGEEVIELFGYVLPRLIGKIEKEINEKYPFFVKALIYTYDKIKSIPILAHRITKLN
jgi:hypothetical protein